MNHLSIPEVIAAVYDLRDHDIDRDRVDKHISECNVCKTMIDNERESNPLVGLPEKYGVF